MCNVDTFKQKKKTLSLYTVVILIMKYTVMSGKSLTFAVARASMYLDIDSFGLWNSTEEMNTVHSNNLKSSFLLAVYSLSIYLSSI